MTNDEMSHIATQVLNHQLTGSPNSLDNAFRVYAHIEEGYLDFVPMLPAVDILGDLTSESELAKKARNALASAFFPYFSFFPTPPYLVAENTDSFSTARGLRFFFSVGQAERMVFDHLSDYEPIRYKDGYLLPMQSGFGHKIGSGIVISPTESANLLIAGRSGSGKTITLLGLLELASKYGEKSLMTVIDGKNDSNLRKYCQRKSINYIAQNGEETATIFLSRVNETLKKYEDLILRRAKRLAHGEVTLDELPYATLVVDESLAFLETAPRGDREKFLSLQSRLVLLNRAEKCQYIVSSQNFTGGTNGNISTVARDNFQNVILLTQDLKRDGRFIYHNSDLSSVMIPRDSISNKGVGVIQTNGGFVTPFLAPYFRSLD